MPQASTVCINPLFVLYFQSIGMYWPADNLIINHGIFSVGCKESETSQFYTLKKLSLICHGQVNHIYYYIKSMPHSINSHV